MVNRISLFSPRIPRYELENIQRYIRIFRGQGSPTENGLRDLFFYNHVENTTDISPALAEFLVKDEDCDPEIWFLLTSDMGPSFRDTLTLLVKDYGSGKLCRKAHISRRVYYQLFKPDYRPSKDVIIRIGMASGLSLGETCVLLNRADYKIDKFSDRDLIINYCFDNGLTDIGSVNYTLRRLGHAPLARK